jgi:hypothetical protein
MNEHGTAVPYASYFVYGSSQRWASMEADSEGNNMATLGVTLDTSHLGKEIEAKVTQYVNAAMVVRLAELLNLSEQDAALWLVAKVAAFRGCGEAEVAEQIGVGLS